ncbi:MAG TPA: response regulator [Thermoanaerobaculia bacterium]|nr:response regulator [Thermoanaerobaculia bacterium]
MTEQAPISATILSVDDDEANLYVRSHALRRAGFQVIEADRAAQVLPLVATYQPDLILLDVHLPDGNGYDICREIKTHPDYQSTIVVQTSASYVDRADKLLGYSAGADSYLLEPIEPEELVATVTALLRLRSMERDLRRSAIEWQKTFEAVHDGVAIVQESGIISRCNPAFDLMAGQASAGRTVDEMLSPEGTGSLRELLAESVGTHARTTTDLQLHDRFLRLSIDPVLDHVGQVTHFACILSDVTAERQIAALNEQLTTTVERLRRAKVAADAAARAKDEFLATLSHELRTPMTSIIGWAQMLRMFGKAQVNPEEAADAILASARAQSQLVEDLLDLSRITTGKLRLNTEIMDVAEVVESAVQTIVPAAAAKRITIDRHIVQAHVAGDHDRIQQVLWNLLSNAVKFTPDGGRVDVSVEVKGPRIVISVTDTGRGIEPQFLPAVFDRFSQADDVTNRAIGGLGLGLAIVRHIVELHGGEVAAESAGLGEGSTFRVMLPVVGSDLATPAIGEHAMPHLRNRRILVVDDSRESLEMFAAFLRAAGATVFPATSVTEALELNARENIDAIVTDISMPGQSGLDLIATLRTDAISGRPGRVIIAITALGTGAHDEAMKAGATAFLEKPFGPAELVRLLADL